MKVYFVVCALILIYIAILGVAQTAYKYPHGEFALRALLPLFCITMAALSLYQAVRW